jgi:lyso-ornithine lipid O-acyltransferase
MESFLTREARKIRRLIAFIAAAFYGLWRHRSLPANPTRAQCAEWLQETCARGLRSIDVELSVEGVPPQRGLIVSNHLSYLDILCCSAATPCVFVSKAEVEQWPIFGRYTRWSGSVFVQRHDRGDAARANTSVGKILNDGVSVVLFPEGTTTDGQRVLRFHSTMMQPAIDAGAAITPCAIRYELEDGDVGREVAWWGDMTLIPHVLNLLGKKSIRAHIMFGTPVVAAGHRKELSTLLHNEVEKLRSPALVMPFSRG